MLCSNRAVVSWLLNMYDIILFPFLEIVPVMLRELLTFRVMGAEGLSSGRAVHVLDNGFGLLVECPLSAVEVLANSV